MSLGDRRTARSVCPTGSRCPGRQRGAPWGLPRRPRPRPGRRVRLPHVRFWRALQEAFETLNTLTGNTNSRLGRRATGCATTKVYRPEGCKDRRAIAYTRPMPNLSREEFVALVERERAGMPGTTLVVPLAVRLIADQLTPVVAYRRLVAPDQREAPSFLLESVEGRERQGRYSILGAQPHVEVIAREFE